MHESDVILTLVAQNAMIDDAELEEYTFAVLAAVEEHAADVALGPVVAADFSDHAIEVAFTVLHDAPSGAHAATSRVLEVIEEYTPIDFGLHDSRVREADHESADALAC
jgi:hypothetical protein